MQILEIFRQKFGAEARAEVTRVMNVKAEEIQAS